MADSHDLELLESGALDLSRCDFREADLRGRDLRNRSFTHCLFQKAQCESAIFDGSDFRGAQVSFMIADNASFDGCNLEELHFGYTQLSGASVRGVRGNGARFQHAKLNQANLQDSDFRGGEIDADTDLDGVVANENTNFEAVRVLRPTSRNILFADYHFENGTLRRLPIDTGDNAPKSEAVASTSGVQDLPENRKIETAVIQIRRLLQNAAVTRLTAAQFANQIEEALQGVPTSNGNQLVEPLQTMLEFAEVLRSLATDSQQPDDPLDRPKLELRIAQLEALVARLTQQLSDETKAREAAEALMKSDGFMANFRKSAGKASGTAVVTLATSLVTVGVPTAAIYFLGSEHPLVTSVFSLMGRASK